MKVMVCIPVDVAVDTTRRKDLREAVRSKLKSEIGSAMVMDSLTADNFVVRAPESKPEKP